jgi:integrase
VAKRVLFGDVVAEYIPAHEKEWTNDLHAQQWRDTIEKYTAPITRRPVADITVAEVADCLRADWHRIRTTMQRTRARIACIFDYAIAQGWRTAANPAAWGTLKHVLGNGVMDDGEDRHHAAIDWRKLPALYAKLERDDTPAVLALRWIILTACRTGEAQHMSRIEADTKAKVWTIPAKRMKRKRLHRVPLSPAALAILETRPQEEGQPLVFGNLGPNMIRDALARIGGFTTGECTVHGMRSAFSDWALDNRLCSSEVADVALAHKVKSKTRRAYQRTDYLDERRQVMNAWAHFLTTEARAEKIRTATPLAGPFCNSAFRGSGGAALIYRLVQKLGLQMQRGARCLWYYLTP